MVAPLTLAFVLAAGLCLALLPATITLARRLGCLAHPGGRHAHLRTTPLAGAAVLGAVLIVAAPAVLERETLLILGGALAICLLGVVDDRTPVPAAAKLAGQAAVAVAVVAGGLGGSVLELPLVGGVELGWLRIPILAIFLVLTVNAVNLLDGLDGLAPGVGVISSLTLMVLSLGTGHPEVALISAALAGSCGGFLVANLRGRAFLGDQGSLTLGFLLGACAIGGLGKTGTTVALLPVLILALPLMDASAVTLARLRAGLSPWRADRRHLHHRLLRQGLTPAAVRWRLWAIASACGGYAVVVERTGFGRPSGGALLTLAIGAAGLLVIGILVVMILRAGRRVQQRAGQAEAAEAAG